VLLETHRWGEGRGEGDCVVCLHGVTQHGRIFDGLARRLASAGRSILAVDLRGHGESGREPPWSVETHISDVLETLDAAGVETATWIGHSFGGKLAAELAARAGGLTERLVLLDPVVELTPARALRGAEIDRLDWSFATVDGALNAMLSSDALVAAPRETVAAFVADDVEKGPDGRFRFSFCPGAVVVAWSEMTLPAPPVADCPTLLVIPETPRFQGSGLADRYREALGEKLSLARVPHGHNVLWESPKETISAVEGFLLEGRGGSRPSVTHRDAPGPSPLV